MESVEIGEPISESFEFCDAKTYILLTLYANGSFETKDVDVLSDTDSIEVRTPLNERWCFQLYDQIYSEQTEIQTKMNRISNQTSIEIKLYKQQTRNVWPQLYTLNSTPVIPPGSGDSVNESEQIDGQNNDKLEELFDEIALKNFKTDYYQIPETLTLSIFVKNLSECNVEFRETNFTVKFRTKDEKFLNTNQISGDRPIKIFVRTQERIIPDRSSWKISNSYLEIVLVKEKANSTFWSRVEAAEYSEDRLSTTSPPSPISSSIISNGLNLNKAIPLAPPCPSISSFRLSDKNLSSHAFSAAIEKNQSRSMMSSSLTAIGYTGIHNPANSCFMNAAIQCLSNTCELRDYFLSDSYKSEINRTNPLGMKGIMAEEFAQLLKNLWNGKNSWTYADKIREYAAKRHQEFVGNGQHDAQELLTILLDAVHEDLNRVIVKPLVPPVEDQGRADKIVADEYWRGYLSRNDSIIVKLFTGQFKSKTKCPVCLRESVAFDPFTSISVPVLKRTTVETVVIFRDAEKSAVKYRIVMSSDGPVTEFKRILSNKCQIPTQKMIVYKVRNSRSIELLKDDERVTTSGYSSSSDVIFVAETLTPEEFNNERIHRFTFIQRVFRLNDFVSKCGYCEAAPNPHVPSKSCNKCFQVFYCDEKCLKFHQSDHKSYCGFRASEMFDFIGTPFVVSLPESKLNYENLFEQIQINIKRTVNIEIRKSKTFRGNKKNGNFNDEIYSDTEEDEDEESFSDVENVDWTTIKTTLSSADSWSICRLGDYFVKNNQTKRRRNGNQRGNRKEKFLKNNSKSSMKNGNFTDESTTDEDFEIFDRTTDDRPLFRLMPLPKSGSNFQLPAIVEPGEEANRILSRYSDFSIDWFTDNKREAPLRISPSRNYHGINGLVEHESLNDSSSNDNDLTLQQCLQLFIEPEVLGPDDKWYCPTCKEHIQAEKRMSVWRLPPVLIIHLKRFKYYHGSSFGYFSDTRTKIDSFVKFPIHNLDMSAYCSSGSDCSQPRYDLFGVINHRGSAWFGHYTSYARLFSHNDSAKTEIGWRNFDDEHVSTLPVDKDLVRSDAYVLFYRQRNVSVDVSSVDSNSSIKSPDPMEISEDFQFSTRILRETDPQHRTTMEDIDDLVK